MILILPNTMGKYRKLQEYRDHKHFPKNIKNHENNVPKLQIFCHILDLVSYCDPQFLTETLIKSVKLNDNKIHLYLLHDSLYFTSKYEFCFGNGNFISSYGFIFFPCSEFPFCFLLSICKL